MENLENVQVGAVLNFREMEEISGGVDCKGLSYACGVGLGVSVIFWGIGTVLYGPSTVGLCSAAYVACA